jgi:hypothetical protein
LLPPATDFYAILGCPVCSSPPAPSTHFQLTHCAVSIMVYAPVVPLRPPPTNSPLSTPWTCLCLSGLWTCL